MKFEVVKSESGKFFFRIKASNGQTLAHSQQYAARSSAINAIERIKQDAGKAPVLDAES